MDELIPILVSNAALAGALSIVGFAVWKLTGSAPLARGLWVLALIKLVTPPVFEVETEMLPSFADADRVSSVARPLLPVVPGGGIMGEDSTVASEAAGVGAPPPSAPGPGRSAAARLSGFLALVWILGTAGCLVSTLLRMRRGQVLVARACPAPPAIVDLVSGVAHRLGLSRAPRVRMVDARISPFLWAFGSCPTVVLPEGMMRALSHAEREAVVAHELAHLARRDNLVRWLEIAVMTVHWWNPVARWTCRRLHEVEELCCDARAVSVLPAKPRQYGAAILKATEFLDPRSTVPRGAMGLGNAKALKRRIVMIVSKRLHHRLGWPVRLGMALLAFAVLPWGVQAQECTCKKDKNVVVLKKDGNTFTIRGGVAAGDRIIEIDGTKVRALKDGKFVGVTGDVVKLGDGDHHFVVVSPEGKGANRFVARSGKAGGDVYVFESDASGNRPAIVKRAKGANGVFVVEGEKASGKGAFGIAQADGNVRLFSPKGKQEVYVARQGKTQSKGKGDVRFYTQKGDGVYVARQGKTQGKGKGDVRFYTQKGDGVYVARQGKTQGKGKGDVRFYRQKGDGVYVARQGKTQSKGKGDVRFYRQKGDGVYVARQGKTEGKGKGNVRFYAPKGDGAMNVYEFKGNNTTRFGVAKEEPSIADLKKQIADLKKKLQALERKFQ